MIGLEVWQERASFWELLSVGSQEELVVAVAVASGSLVVAGC